MKLKGKTIRANSRIYLYQDIFIKTMARKLKIGDAEAMRIIIDVYIKLAKENGPDTL